MGQIKKLAKSLLPSTLWILAVVSSCVWVFMLFCTMKSENLYQINVLTWLCLLLKNWMLLVFAGIQFMTKLSVRSAYFLEIQVF